MRRSTSNLHLDSPKPGRRGAFTILEMLIVLGIIGLLTTLALPHLKGLTESNSMTVAIRQLTDDINLARQRAAANRTRICLVFSPPPTNWTFVVTNGATQSAVITNVYMHQYAAYALVALRSVGDQPGRSNVHYLTDWKYLPKGVFVEPFQFNGNAVSNQVFVTNTTSGYISNYWVTGFPTDVLFPFPSLYQPTMKNLPYICFTPNGQLNTPNDQYIMLTRGGIFYPLDQNNNPVWGTPPDLVETPPSNGYSNPELIHIDPLTARVTVEQNRF